MGIEQRDTTVADLEIEKRGGGCADFCKNLHTTQPALICSRRVCGHVPLENFEI